MRSRFAICIFFAFVLCPNTFFGQSGRTAMVTAGSWYCGTLSDSTNYWDIAALPSYNGTHNVGWGESGFGILKTTKSPSKAMAVIMTIAHTIEFYATGSPSLPTIKNLRNEAIAM